MKTSTTIPGVIKMAPETGWTDAGAQRGFARTPKFVTTTRYEIFVVGDIGFIPEVGRVRVTWNPRALDNRGEAPATAVPLPGRR